MCLVSLAVMQTDRVEYLKERCLSLLTELLEYMARINEHSVIVCCRGNWGIMDDSILFGGRLEGYEGRKRMLLPQPTRTKKNIQKAIVCF